MIMNDLYKKLDGLIDKYDNFIIMGHVNPDLDALGSSLALYFILKKLNKEVNIFLDYNHLDKYSDSLVNAVNRLSNVSFVCADDYTTYSNTLLFVLDVHSKKRLEYPEILDNNIDVVVLDHHIRNRDYIKNTVLTYIDSNLSSMVELMIGYVNYSKVELDTTSSSIMLAGLEIDTNGYNLKTTSYTYRAASMLLDNHADIILKQALLKESKDDYIKRADYIKSSFKVNDKVAMCILTDEVETEELALIADDLLKFTDIEASFAIAPIANDKIGISTRSIGTINVEKIVKKLGGGGSKTNAAAQVDLTLRETKKIIMKLIKEIK